MTNSQTEQNSSSTIAIVIIVVAIIALAVFFFSYNKTVKTPVQAIITVPSKVTPKKAPPIAKPTPVVAEPVAPIQDEVVVPVIKKDPLPTLDQSDPWLQKKLLSMTWRKELLKLIIDDDMIRRFVVFTDNFANGQIAYEHSPVIRPHNKFTVIESSVKMTKDHQQVWLWDKNSTHRFNLYVDLLRSFDTDTLVKWYIELKPLIDQAYSELGYPDEDFTATLQGAINRVLDMEIPKQPIEIIRPSVMYRFKDPKIESLDAADKLMLRLGKENLLVVKSVLLEISEKLARQVNTPKN